MQIELAAETIMYHIEREIGLDNYLLINIYTFLRTH